MNALEAEHPLRELSRRVLQRDLEAALRLFERHERLDAFAAVLAATAIEHGAEALVSADRAFGEVRRLRFVELGSRRLDALPS
jgi:predicted nucleic acid-binding protein